MVAMNPGLRISSNRPSSKVRSDPCRRRSTCYRNKSPPIDALQRDQPDREHYRTINPSQQTGYHHCDDPVEPNCVLVLFLYM